MSFSPFDLHPDLVGRLADRGFTAPTSLQREVLAPALAGRDVLARASSGSGKTTALLLPVIHRLLARSGDGPRAVVVAADAKGARRLAGEVEALAAGTSLTWATAGEEGADGGAPFSGDLLVATPEDLPPLLEADGSSLAGVETLGLYDADRMVERDLQPVLERLVAALPSRRQTLIFAAALPPELASFAEAAQADAARVGWPREPAVSDEAALPVREDLKGALLLELLGRDGIERALVFTRTKLRVNRLAQWLRHHGVPSERIHGNRSPRQRGEALAGFAAGRYRVLVATDVNADGLPDEVPVHIVHYDVPNSPDDYRGRLALGQGAALTLVGDLDESRFRALERALGRPLPARHLEGFDYDAVPADGMEVPMDEGPAEARGRKARGKSRGRGKGRGDRRQAEDGRGGGPPAGDVDLDADEEARIRQKAERVQEAAVAARLGRPQPWTAGWQEFHARQSRRRPKSPKRKSRGR